jgi:hypothetical protein
VDSLCSDSMRYFHFVVIPQSGCGEQGFPSAHPYLSHILHVLNAVNNQRALDLRIASVSELGLVWVIWVRILETAVREVRAGKNRVRGVRIPTAVRCVIYLSRSAMVVNKSPRAQVQFAIDC